MQYIERQNIRSRGRYNIYERHIRYQSPHALILFATRMMAPRSTQDFTTLPFLKRDDFRRIASAAVYFAISRFILKVDQHNNRRHFFYRLTHWLPYRRLYNFDDVWPL